MNKDQEYKLDVEVNAGRIAKSVADSVKPYFEQAKDNLLGTFLSTAPGEAEQLQAIRRQIEALDAIWQLILMDVDTGLMAAKTLETIDE
jgi:hypothetical protein